jgi:hypothetical protein
MSAEVLLLNAGGDEVFRIAQAGYKVVQVSGKRFAARAVPVKSLPFRMWDRIKDKLCGV